MNPRSRQAVQALLLCVALHFACAAPTGFSARNETTTENVEMAVKAAYLYKFLGYVEWPAALFSRPDAPFVIGVAGDDAIVAELERITADRNVNGRPMSIRRIGPDDTLAGLHLLYLGAVGSARQAQLLKQARQRPILTVANAEANSGVPGAIINFKVVDSRVRFAVALDVAERSGLHLSSRLLSVALSVHPGTTQ